MIVRIELSMMSSVLDNVVIMFVVVCSLALWFVCWGPSY